MTPISIVAYVALFAASALLFVLAALLLGRLLRPQAPSAEKLQPYECGEPAVGSSFLQFDLRFYVVALVFIIFEVEVAFFFPWATVFGKLTRLRDANLAAKATPEVYRALGVPQTPGDESPPLGAAAGPPAEIGGLARAAMIDIAVFFAVLLVGFAYVWYRGDLNWVRATGRESPADRNAAGAV